jgi:N-acetylglutamate synthase-like GNAT family acetyltransferase
VRIEQSNSISLAHDALPLLQSLDRLYPGFRDWYLKTVIPGLALGRDKLLVALQDTRIIGVALGKRSDDETKLRCVRVIPEFEHSGVGIRLIDSMLDVLECEKPHCTVAQEMFHSYSRPFVERYGFELSGVDKGRYRRGVLEYSFN